MELRHTTGWIALAATLAVSTEAMAQEGARALSYSAFDNIIFLPVVGGEGNFVTFPGTEVAQTNSAAVLEGVPGGPGGGGKFDINPSCVSGEGTPVAAAPPCPPNNFFNQVPGFGNNKISRGDSQELVAGVDPR